MRGTHTALPGIVRSYNASEQTIEVQPAVREGLPSATDDEDGPDTVVSYPVLVSVPVAFPRGGGMFIHFPLEEGDSVLLVFCEADLNAWRQTGDESDPGLDMRHSLSGAVAIPGLFPRNNPIPSGDAPASALRMGVEGGNVIQIKSDFIHLGAAVSGFVAMAAETKSRLDTIQAAFDAHTHTGVTVGAGSTGVPAAIIGPLAGIAATKVKAE